jgi:hypothetical protein
LTVERLVGWSFGFFSTAWGFVATIAITRLITAKISHERPLGAVITMCGRELMAPRERTSGEGGAVTASRLRVRATRPIPKSRRRTRKSRYPADLGRPSQSHPGYPFEYIGAQGTPRARRDRTSFPAGR